MVTIGQGSEFTYPDIRNFSRYNLLMHQQGTTLRVLWRSAESSKGCPIDFCKCDCCSAEADMECAAYLWRWMRASWRSRG